VKISDSLIFSAASETDFDPVQLDLPLRPAGEFDAIDDIFPVECRSSHAILSEYLQTIGVADPDAAAGALLSEFRTLGDLLSGSWWRLRRAVGGRLASVIRASRALMHASLAEPLNERPIVPRPAQLIDFLQARIGYLQHERLLAIYVDSRLHLLSIQKLADGAVSRAPVDFARIIQLGLNVGASGFLLVHNHPSGVPRPSKADLAVTSRLRDLAGQLDLHLLDHLIVARGKVASIEDHWRESRWRGDVE